MQGVPNTVVAPNSPVVVTSPQTNNESNKCEEYSFKQATLLGIAQIITGALCVIIQIIANVLNAEASQTVVGVWCGIPYIITGVFGVLSGKTKSRALITACMVMCIVTASLFVLPLLIASSVGFTRDKSEYYCNVFLFEYTTCPPNPDREAKVGLNVILLILCLLEFFFAIWASSLCCGVICCGGSARPGQVITHPMVINGQVQTTSTGNQVLVAQQPAAMTVYPSVQQPQPVEMRKQPTAPVPSYHEYSEVGPPPAYEQPVGGPVSYHEYSQLN